jgi:ABC-type multidrug transport system ATPase subunit
MINIEDLSLEKKIPVFSQLNLRVEDGESYVLLSSAGSSVDHLINIFTDLERDFKGTVEIDGSDIRCFPGLCRTHMAFLSAGGLWPQEMKIRDLISFLKRSLHIPADEFEEFCLKLNLDNISQKPIAGFEEVEWRRILLAMVQLKKCKNYIFRDFARGMPMDFNIGFKRNLLLLRKKPGAILYLGDDIFLAPEIGDRIGFMKKGKILLELKAAKMKQMNLRELYFHFLVDSR